MKILTILSDVPTAGSCFRCRRFSVNQDRYPEGSFPIKKKKDRNAMDSDEKLVFKLYTLYFQTHCVRSSLLDENALDPLAGEQTWPTEAEIAAVDANCSRHKFKKKKLPHSTSDYQAAWIVDDIDDEVSDDADERDGMVLDEQQMNHTVLEGSDYSDVDEGSHDMVEETEMGEEMDDDEKLTKEQIEADIKKIKNANVEDEEFPDEVDTPLDVPAKKRFAKYRGLKSFRTLSWDTKESLPL